MALADLCLTVAVLEQERRYGIHATCGFQRLPQQGNDGREETAHEFCLHVLRIQLPQDCERLHRRALRHMPEVL